MFVAPDDLLLQLRLAGHKAGVKAAHSHQQVLVFLRFLLCPEQRFAGDEIDLQLHAP